MLNDGYLLGHIQYWTDDPEILKQILMDTPARLYGD
jgi:hypothetical protein